MKKKIAISIALLAVLSITTLWYVKSPHREVSITENIRNIQHQSTCFPLSRLYQDAQWDRVIIGKPYDLAPSSDPSIDMGYGGDRDVIRNNACFDSFCTLIFLKGNRLVAFSTVNRDDVDFSMLSRSSYTATDSIKVKKGTAQDCD
ncbi:MAG: hypothetical protein K6A82_09065 [Prevotella sp.]|nr:hypothetical protein [Prevotella sp.]